MGYSKGGDSPPISPKGAGKRRGKDSPPLTPRAWGKKWGGKGRGEVPPLSLQGRAGDSPPLTPKGGGKSWVPHYDSTPLSPKGAGNGKGEGKGKWGLECHPGPDSIDRLLNDSEWPHFDVDGSFTWDGGLRWFTCPEGWPTKGRDTAGKGSRGDGKRGKGDVSRGTGPYSADESWRDESRRYYFQAMSWVGLTTEEQQRFVNAIKKLFFHATGNSIGQLLGENHCNGLCGCTWGCSESGPSGGARQKRLRVMAYYWCKWEHLHQWHRGDPDIWAMVRLKQWHPLAWETMIQNTRQQSFDFDSSIPFYESSRSTSSSSHQSWNRRLGSIDSSEPSFQERLRLCNDVEQKISNHIRDAVPSDFDLIRRLARQLDIIRQRRTWPGAD